MTESFNEYITLIVPAALVPDANHMVNCFESCLPSQPVLALADEASEVRIVVPVRPSWLAGVLQMIQAHVIPEPEWNQHVTPEDAEPYDLVNMTAARRALDVTVLYDPTQPLPTDRIVLARGNLLTENLHDHDQP